MQAAIILLLHIKLGYNPGLKRTCTDFCYEWHYARQR